ncbi:MAG TPA: hypothetical protein VN132_02965, partial [Bdellovibrio sp.]|nr:hypothetical protein [Bdellovibrio sp.]
MNKLILSLATLALAFATTANARTTSSTSTERSYASSSSSSFLAGGSNENEFTTLLTRGALVSEKPCKDCDSGTTFDISASYLRYLKDGFQVGAEARLQSLSKYNSG